MGTIKSTAGYDRWEQVTRKWWFFLILVLMQFVIPPYSSEGVGWQEIGDLTSHILQNSIMFSLTVLYPVFQVIPILLIAGILLFRNKASRLFSIYAGISYILFAVLQNISITEQYGFAVLTLNIIMFIFVAAFWFWEAFRGLNDFSSRPRPFWKYWVVPLAFVTFWFPVNQTTLGPDFNPLYLLTSGSGLTFCMMTPVYLAVLTIFHPQINLVTLRITSLIGLIIGFYNMLVNFVFGPSFLWWNGVLHIPLVVLSVYGLVLSFRKD